MPSAPKLAGQGTVSLDDAVFGEGFHEPVVHEAVRAELAARRRGTASTRTRGEIAMTGAKALVSRTAIEPRAACTDSALRSAARRSLRLTLKV